MRGVVKEGLLRETARIIGYFKCVMENTCMVNFLKFMNVIDLTVALTCILLMSMRVSTYYTCWPTVCLHW